MEERESTEDTFLANEGVLPPGWAYATLSEACEINPRMTWSASFSDDLQVTFVPMAAVDDVAGVIESSEIRPISEVWKGYTRFAEGDVLFAKITPCMENGKAAIAQGLENGLGFGSTEFHVLRPTEAVIAKWIYYYVRQQGFRDAAAHEMTGTAGQLRVPSRYLSSVYMPLAPLSEQRRIVEVIEAQFTRLDAGIAALKRLQANLERYKAAVLKAACEGKLVPQDPDDEPASELLARILNQRREKWEADQRAKGKDPGKLTYPEPAVPDTSDLPELPAGWVWASLDQLSKRITDGTHQPPEFTEIGVPFIFIKHIVDGQFSFEDTRFISEATYTRLNSRCPVEKGDILYTAVGSYGVAVPVWIDQRFSFQRHIAHIKPAFSWLASYIALCLNSPLGLTQAHRVAKGVAQKTVTLGDLAKFALPLAPANEQLRIFQKVDEKVSIIDMMNNVISSSVVRAERLRQSVLKKAFAGQLVPQDLNDEPASDLLKRIQHEREQRKKQKA